MSFSIAIDPQINARSLSASRLAPATVSMRPSARHVVSRPVIAHGSRVVAVISCSRPEAIYWWIIHRLRSKAFGISQLVNMPASLDKDQPVEFLVVGSRMIEAKGAMPVPVANIHSRLPGRSALSGEGRCP